MLEIFKNKILPKLETTQLSAPAAKALLQVLELQDCQDTKVLEQVKNSIGNLNNEAVFTEELAQQIYYHPEVYANEEEGIAFMISWLPLLENGFYPDKKSSEKLIEFLYFSLGYLQSEAISEKERIQIFSVLKALVQSESNASLTVAHFLIRRVFDIRDCVNSDFIIQNCITHQILLGNYYVLNSDNGFTKNSFSIDNEFVHHFFKGDWHKFVNALHLILPVGKVYQPNAFNIITAWLSSDLAEFYQEHTDLVFAAHTALNERFLFMEEEGIALLNLQTKDGIFPLISALGTKEWDAGDVLLFNNRDKNIPQNQLDQCYLRFLDWLKAESGSNFYTEAFQAFGKHILTVESSTVLPVAYILFWFEKCNPKSGISDQIEPYNSLFSRFLSTGSTGKLPVVRLGIEDVELKGEYLIEEIFQIKNNRTKWISDLDSSNLSDPLNQFLILTFYDAREKLATLFDLDNQKVLFAYLEKMAYSTKQADDKVKKECLPLVVKTLTALFAETNDFTLVNKIWALKNIDPSVLDLCNDYAQLQYVNESRPLFLGLLQSWYNFLSDYYYSLGTESVWIPHMLNTQGRRSAAYLNELDENVSHFLNRALVHLFDFHKKSKQKAESNQLFQSIQTDIENYLEDFLKELMEHNLAKETAENMYIYSKAHFAHRKKLQESIQKHHDYHKVEESKSEKAILVEQLQKSQINSSEMTFDPKYASAVLHNLENYKTEGTCDSKLLEVLDKNIIEFKTWLSETSATEAKFIQALYMTLLDKNLAPETPLETYGNLCRNLFVKLAKNSKMASSYQMGLAAMANSGAYPENLTTALLQVVNLLKA
ncbi:hypothetical protein VBZ51_01920 [Maribacter sp. HS]|uniref:hypothetical protein n=1 Tax=Maribacter sp. HS TaxID=3110480 RepID=UPI003A838E23